MWAPRVFGPGELSINDLRQYTIIRGMIIATVIEVINLSSVTQVVLSSKN